MQYPFACKSNVLSNIIYNLVSLQETKVATVIGLKVLSTCDELFDKVKFPINIFGR